MKSGYTHICLVADRSGSMAGIASDMNGAIEKFLGDQAAEPGELLIDVVGFSSEVDVLHDSVKVEDVRKDVIRPLGMTALNDGIGVAITRLGAKFALMDEDDRPEHVIVVIVTDGHENASREYTTEQIKKMVTEQQDKWNWTFYYLAANVDAFATGGGYGFGRGQTISYSSTAGSTRSVYDSLSASATRTRSGLRADFTDEERKKAQGEAS